MANVETRGHVARAVAKLLAGFLVVGTALLLLTRALLSAAVSDPATTQAQYLSQDTLNWAFGVTNVSMYWPLLVALAGILVLALFLRRVLSQRAMQTVILTLIVVDLFALGMSYHTTVPAETIFPETPILSLVKSDRSIFRVVGTSTDFMPNTAMAHDLYDVRGLVFPERRYRELCQAMGGEDWVGIGILFPNDLPSRFLDLLNVKYVLTSSALGPDVLRNLSLVDRDGDIRLYESLSYLPRAFVVHRVRVGEDDQEILGMLRDHEFDMGAEIVLEKPPPAGFAGSIAAPQGTAEITRYEPNHVTIVASTATDGFLFLSESYDAGWRVYVDGLESEVYRADYAFRAVYLTAGEHQVEWIYTPRSFQLGLVVSLMAAFCVIFLLAGKRP